MTASKIALVLGATGSIGYEAARALDAHGWVVRALTRDVDRAARTGASFYFVEGDATDPASVVQAARGASLIVHAANPPSYRGWSRLVLPMADSVIAAARASGARIVLPGTVYNYGPDAMPVLAPDSPQNPRTEKGRVRVALERRLEAAADDGVRTIILRFGDFFGPRLRSSWFRQGMVRPGRPITGVFNPGRAGIAHPWTYAPDGAEALARLADIEATLPPFARYHFAGHLDETGTTMVETVARLSTEPRVRITRVPWTALAVLGLFNETMRESARVKSFWRAPYRLDNASLVAAIGPEPHTPLRNAVRITLHGLGCPTKPEPGEPSGTSSTAPNNTSELPS
ncbi:hypothetical protein DLJ53_28045 [Acuticoccus sediminis]|uniref:NAD-dependent epimerase/dehydratase domain-containing protein n=1 Tax=Acuticoccus sediminis TaxID=2184697 RepID=A0A8B2NRE0_9HYPH|nr:NAD-dependent epimerase/dehydratase family protein [Acuticoccus sediminis]RAH97700.1 hypothetical protein DLJ53_28045 [Acuticoccus sediminis]